MSDEIQCFKLKSGEEMITRIVSSEENHFVLDRPRVLVAQQTGPNQLGIVAMVPWMFSDPDGEILLYKDQIAGELRRDVPKALEDGYLKETSGIELATSLPPRT